MGDTYTTDADTTTSPRDHHTTTLQDYSDHQRITYYLQTSTHFISRCSAEEDNKDRFTDQRLHRSETSPTRDHRTADQILLQPSQEAIYPLHEKYGLQEVHGCKFRRFDANIIKATRIDRPDETINLGLSVYLLYHSDHKRWIIIKGPTFKNYEEAWYDAIEKIETTPNPYDNIVTWIEFLEKVCEDPDSESSLQT